MYKIIINMVIFLLVVIKERKKSPNSMPCCLELQSLMTLHLMIL